MARKTKFKPKFQPGDKVMWLKLYSGEVIRYEPSAKQYVVAAFGDEIWVPENELARKES